MKNPTKPILFVVLLALIGLTGWYAWHIKSSTDKTLDQTNDSSNTQTTKRQSVPKAPTTNPIISSGYSGNGTIEQAQLSQIPRLQDVVISHVRATTPGCVGSDGRLVNETGQSTDPVVSYITGAAAAVTACQARQLYAVMEGEQWMYVATTQGSYKCSDLQKYDIPKALVANGSSGNATCTTDNNQQATYKD